MNIVEGWNMYLAIQDLGRMHNCAIKGTQLFSQRIWNCRNQ
jgi:hypothetical protein